MPSLLQHGRRYVESFAAFMALVGLYAFASSFFLSKHSLPLHRSECDHDAPQLLRAMGLSEPAVRQLQHMKLISNSDDDDIHGRRRNGCWMDRRADSVIILLVDALRIDFVRQLTKSVQSRLAAVSSSSDLTNGTTTVVSSSRLFRFVADPPTVTTQRIKALTTGGLPTFADISTNFGGATVEDDNWLFQLQQCPVHKRGYNVPNDGAAARIGFVGDDTWIDLYPHSFYDPHPYPSFNTRDIHTVDNGCVHHLPALLDNVRPHPQQNLEVAIVHFLGVDHVGHTYGPHNEHMDAKLAQMDETLDYVLTYLDNNESERSCKIVLIFGDHGMTGDGNHGGGTIEEVSAGLFAHATPSCGGFLLRENSHNHDEGEVPSIHQIDLVPTLSFLLGIPIPFANLGRVVPSLLPMPPKQERANQEGESAATPSASAHTAVAMALNAGQVWRYLNTYRQTFGGQLQGLEPKLLSHLQRAVTLLEDAILTLSTKEENGDAAWMQASEAFKDFLGRALELGQQAWTQFDIPGMVAGIAILAAAIVMFAVVTYGTRSTTPAATATRSSAASSNQDSHASLDLAATGVETALAGTFVLYHCGILTFSNSYILEEQRSLQFATGALCCAVALRYSSAATPATSHQSKSKALQPLIQPRWMWAMLIPVASRLHELLVSGHGLDPSIRLHSAHSPAMFLPCLMLLLLARWNLHRRRIVVSIPHWIGDGVSLAALGVGWVEKRSTDPSRTGFAACRIALALAGVGLLYSLFRVRAKAASEVRIHRHTCLAVLCKLLVVLVSVTGPSTAATVVLYVVQVAALVHVSPHLPGIVTATLVKLITRHAFFATNHACFFNRLQYSAAFVTTTEFNFVTGGLSLFLNTFGWELAGMLVCFALKRRPVWTCYVSMQLVEALCSCISVSVLRRHLMVWDIYAPHFLFTSIFTILTCLSHVTASILSGW
jgi:GPI ethanolamine phosphate transferase 3 subunit O